MANRTHTPVSDKDFVLGVIERCRGCWVTRADVMDSVSNRRINATKLSGLLGECIAEGRIEQRTGPYGIRGRKVTQFRKMSSK
jgi:hypothetical protein